MQGTAAAIGNNAFWIGIRWANGYWVFTYIRVQTFLLRISLGGISFVSCCCDYRFSINYPWKCRVQDPLCFCCSSVRWVGGLPLFRSIWKIILVKHSHRWLRPERWAIDCSSVMCQFLSVAETVLWYDLSMINLGTCLQELHQVLERSAQPRWEDSEDSGAMQVQSFFKHLRKRVEGLHTKDPMIDVEGEAKEKSFLYGDGTTVRQLSFLACNISKRTQEVWDGAWEGALFLKVPEWRVGDLVCLKIACFVWASQVFHPGIFKVWNLG